MKLRWLVGGLLLTCASLSSIAHAQELKSLQLDLQDPAILEVRAIWRSVIDAVDAGELKQEHETGDCTDRTRWRDRSGVVRYYLDDGGTGDSHYTIRQYYDAERRLRFIHVTAGAVSGGSMEDRVWISEHGEILRQERKAEGWTFADFRDPSLWTLNPDKVEPGECRG